MRIYGCGVGAALVAMAACGGPSKAEKKRAYDQHATACVDRVKSGEMIDPDWDSLDIDRRDNDWPRKPEESNRRRR